MESENGKRFYVNITHTKTGSTEIGDEEEPILDRILNVFKPFVFSDEPTFSISKQIRMLDGYGSLRELLDELEFLDDWKIVLHDGDRVTMPLDRKMGKMLAVHSFLKQHMDKAGWYSASWYKDQFGIEPSRLRQAAKRGKLPSKGEGRGKVYPLEVAQNLWPEDIQA